MRQFAALFSKIDLPRKGKKCGHCNESTSNRLTNLLTSRALILSPAVHANLPKQLHCQPFRGRRSSFRKRSREEESEEPASSFGKWGKCCSTKSSECHIATVSLQRALHAIWNVEPFDEHLVVDWAPKTSTEFEVLQTSFLAWWVNFESCVPRVRTLI